MSDLWRDDVATADYYRDEDEMNRWTVTQPDLFEAVRDRGYVEADADTGEIRVLGVAFPICNADTARNLARALDAAADYLEAQK